MVGPAELAQFRAELLAAEPHASELMVNYVVAWEVIGALIGHDWARQQMSDKAHPYFLRDAPDGTDDAFRRQHRVIQLGTNLYELQQCRSFDEAVEQMRVRGDIPAIAVEFHVAVMLLRSGHEVRFVSPSGRKGDDFDLLVGVDGVELPVEVKSKDDATAFSPSSLARSLRDARRQLPNGGSGAVIVRVPHHWALREKGEQAVVQEVERALRNSQRVNLILLSWEVWSPAPDRMIYSLMFRPFLNHAPAVAVPGLAALVRHTFVGSMG